MTRPSLIVWSSNYLEDPHKFVLFFLTWEERFHIAHFSKDASNRPNIYVVGVFLRTKENIWGTIPQSHHLMSEAFGRDPWSSCQPKICNLQNVIFWNEKILWFQISVQDLLLMAIVDSLQQLIAKALHIRACTLMSTGSIPFSLLREVMNFFKSY